jgi:hypothetical protein
MLRKIISGEKRRKKELISPAFRSFENRAISRAVIDEATSSAMSMSVLFIQLIFYEATPSVPSSL